MKYRLEVCVDSVESAVIAQRGGADRLEVCANLILGGTTPGVSQFRQIREACSIDLHVLLRPRFGDFLYTDAEYRMLAEDIQMFKEMGADGVVVGCLQADGSLDLERMKLLREKADGIRMTLHRAFDVCRDPYQTLEESIVLGIDTILTSGQRDNCMEGKVVLERLIRQADERIEILVGSGVNAEVICRLADEIHASSFHMSGKQTVSSGMQYRKEHVHMGIPGINEFHIFRTDESQIRAAKQVLMGKMMEKQAGRE